MKPKKNSYPAVNIGSSFMLVILIILSMVIFAVLSLSGALRDARYIERKAGRTANYYQANNTAEKILADIIDNLLAYGNHVPAARPKHAKKRNFLQKNIKPKPSKN